jgi:hypothetical protein
MTLACDGGAGAQAGGYIETGDVPLHTHGSGAHTRLASVQRIKARAARCIPSKYVPKLL